MSEYSPRNNSFEDIDAQLDRLVDVKNISYYDARRELGLPEPDNTDFTAQTIEDRLGPTALGAFKDVKLDIETPEPQPQNGPNPKHGLNHRAWEKQAQDPVEHERIQRNVDLARQSMRDAAKKD
jgi:hypothetical protein